VATKLGQPTGERANSSEETEGIRPKRELQERSRLQEQWVYPIFTMTRASGPGTYRKPRATQVERNRKGSKHPRKTLVWEKCQGRREKGKGRPGASQEKGRLKVACPQMGATPPRLRTSREVQGTQPRSQRRISIFRRSPGHLPQVRGDRANGPHDYPPRKPATASAWRGCTKSDPFWRHPLQRHAKGRVG